MDFVSPADLPRRFYLVRGGAGVVGHGVRWPDGTEAVWPSGSREAGVRQVWVDDPPAAPVRAGYVTFTRRVGAGAR